jgi:SAM-dependent methyltransferase
MRNDRRDEMGNGKQIFESSRDCWENNLKLFPETQLCYPDENLIRLFSGRYVQIPKVPSRVMDHGFGHGNNLLFAAMKGYDCSGCEISGNLVELGLDLFERLGRPADLRLINGLDIPFETQSFDIVISWNVLHYNGTREDVDHVISELHRVLRPGGVLLLSTLHPSSCVFSRMKKLGHGSYLIEKDSEYDNRKGLTFFATRSPEELASLFKSFSETRTGEVYFDLFKPEKRHAAYLLYAVK